MLRELQKLLLEADLSNAWAARRIGISAAYFGNILKGRFVPSDSVKAKIIFLVEQLRKAGLSQAS